jgi:hypothetical protein
MQGRLRMMLLWLLALVAAVHGLRAVQQAKVDQAPLNRPAYDLRVRYFPAERRLEGDEAIRLYLRQAAPEGQLVLHLYPNAFRDAAPFSARDQAGLFQQPGEINITSLQVNGRATTWAVQDTLLSIDLAANRLSRGGRLDLQLSFTLTLPISRGRLGVYDDVHLFGNWYPLLAVAEGGTWRRDPYLPIGDPFYSEMADYRVWITVPASYKVVTSGRELTHSESADGLVQYQFEARDVRDFAWATSPRFQVESRQVGEVLVRSAWFSDAEWGRLATDLAAHTLQVYSRLFGPYYHQSLTVVETGLGVFGGMEYPGLVVLGPYGQRETRIAEAARIEREIAHEVAHQWWYSAVGNDQIREPWLDEALATYSVHLYFADRYGPAELDILRRSRPSHLSGVERRADEFATWSQYFQTVYRGGSHLLDELRLRIGDEAFWQVLQTYYREYKGKIAYSRDFIGLIGEIATLEQAEWFAQALLAR